mgnify:CR=1 FL=1
MFINRREINKCSKTEYKEQRKKSKRREKGMTDWLEK